MVTEGSPRLPSPRPATEVVGRTGSALVGGSVALNPSPPQTPLPRGWAIEGRLGLEQRRGGSSLAPPPTGLGRAQSVTLSLCRRSSPVSRAGSPVEEAPEAALEEAGAVGGMAATDIARQVVSAGLGCQDPGQGPGLGGGDLATATAFARRAVSGIQESRCGGTSAPAISGSVPQPVPENHSGGGRVAKAAGRRLNLNCPISAISAAASLAAAAVPPLGRCRMNGCKSRQALRVSGTLAWLPGPPGRAPDRSCPLRLGLLGKRDPGLGFAWGRSR